MLLLKLVVRWTWWRLNIDTNILSILSTLRIGAPRGLIPMTRRLKSLWLRKSPRKRLACISTSPRSIVPCCWREAPDENARAQAGNSDEENPLQNRLGNQNSKHHAHKHNTHASPANSNIGILNLARHLTNFIRDVKGKSPGDPIAR